MGKQQKPKAKSGDRSTRSNGKAPKQSPKTNVVKNKTSNGYSEAALARRAARREPLTLAGLERPARVPRMAPNGPRPPSFADPVPSTGQDSAAF